MERINKIIFSIFVFFCVSTGVFADDLTPPVKELPHTEFTECVKTFPVNVEKLYYLTLGATSEYNFDLKELQTKGGYIIFETGYRKFLASIIYVSANKSMLKITPYSNNYDFSPEIPQKVFKYIELNQNMSY